MTTAQQESGFWMRMASLASVGTAAVMVVMKAVAFFMTGSTALLGSLLDSVLDMSASIVNLFAVRYSLTEADDEHRFGHGKAESLGALSQAALIAGSAVFLAWESVAQMGRPAPVTASTIGIAVIAASIVLTFGLILFQRFVVAKSGSVAISADLLHYSGDLAMNAGVILALVLSGMFDMHIADPIIGFLIALWLLRGAVKIALSAFDQLMDRELPEEERRTIMEAAVRVDNVGAVHDLRTRQSGLDVFVQLHVELDGGMALYRAHVIADLVEAEIERIHPGAEVFVHLDPAGTEDMEAMYDRLTYAEIEKSRGKSQPSSA